MYCLGFAARYSSSKSRAEGSDAETMKSDVVSSESGRPAFVEDSILKVPLGLVQTVSGLSSAEPSVVKMLRNNPAATAVVKRFWFIGPVYISYISLPLLCGVQKKHNRAHLNYWEIIAGITNNRTGHVFYSRTHDHNSMAVASSNLVLPISKSGALANLLSSLTVSLRLLLLLRWTEIAHLIVALRVSSQSWAQSHRWLMRRLS